MTNMGTVDRVIRTILAIVFAVLYATNVLSGALGVVLLIGAGVFLTTSFTGFCPLYKPFGLNTCRVKKSS